MEKNNLERTAFGPGFPGHLNNVYADELSGFSTTQKALALKARLDDYLISQTDPLATSNPWTPFPLAVMTCIGVEILGSYKYGDPGNNSNRHFQKLLEDMDADLGDKKYAPDGNEIPLSDFVYQAFRNSLVHGLRGKWVFITHDQNEAEKWVYGTSERCLVLNVYWFYKEAFKGAYGAYFESLLSANDENSDPLQTFKETFHEHFSYWLSQRGNNSGNIFR